MHIAMVESELREYYHVSGLNELFVHPYVSYEMGLRKPQAEIYQAVVSESGLIPQETLFIDDLLENVQAAVSCGWHGWHKPSDQELCDALPNYLDKVC